MAFMTTLLRHGLAWLLVFAGLTSNVLAASINISAEFTPSPANPNNKTFTNTTPWSGVCSGTHLPTCMANGWWSINTHLSGIKIAPDAQSTGRDSAWFDLPASRELIARSAEGEETRLKLVINGVGFRYNFITPERPHNPQNAQGCSTALTNGGGGGTNGGGPMRIYVNNSLSSDQTRCVQDYLAGGEYSIAVFDIVYRLETDDPLQLKNGTYTTSTTFSVGGIGNDIDLGDGVTMNDSSLTVNFTLKVNHAFALQFPPGKVDLLPTGGWEQWTEYGNMPKALRQQLPFYITGSSNFNVQLECQYLMVDRRCGIFNSNDSTVPVNINVSMPGFYAMSGGFNHEAIDYPLLAHHREDIPRFRPLDGVVFNRRSYLNFFIDNENDVKEMLNHPGSTYKGQVNVIFNAGL